MNVQKALVSQYLAALAMLRRAVELCPESEWSNPSDRNKFWHVAYHALFYTHFYLADDEESFTPWEKCGPENHFLGPLPWPPHKMPEVGEPYAKEELLEYFDLCEREIRERVPRTSLEAESGFFWLPFNKLETHLYSVRHLQHHAGQLIERLRARTGQGVEWIGKGPDEE